MNAKTNLDSILQRLYRAKAASDGFDSSMPDDPSGDGLMDPQTSAQYETYEDDYENTDQLANMDEDTSESMEEDNEEENSLGTFDLSTSTSEEQSAKGEYEDQLEDPGTSMPAEAGQEKFSSAMNCTLEQNIAVFRKCAESLWQTRQAQQNQVKQAYAYVSWAAPAIGSFTKRAEELGASPEETNEMAAIETIAEEEPELLEALSEASPEELEELMEIADVIESEGGAEGGEDPAVEEKLASFQFTKRAIDEGATPDEANEVAAIEALVQEEPELVEALSEASPEELAELADIANAIEEGGAEEPEISPEEQIDLEKQSFFAQRPANQQLLASMTTSQLQKAAENIDEAIDQAENGTLSEEEIEEILADDETPEAVADEDDLEEKDSCSGRKKKASSLSAEDLYRYSNSSDLYALSLQKRAEEEEAAYESLSPEEQAMIDSASDEELQQAAEQGEAAQEDPELLDSMLSGEAPASEESEEPTEEEALNELASAMEEEGITPEALAEASKEAYYRGDKSAYQDYNTACKVAAFIRSGRHIPGPAKTEKAARVRHFSHNYLKEVMPQR